MHQQNWARHDCPLCDGTGRSRGRGTTHFCESCVPGALLRLEAEHNRLVLMTASAEALTEKLCRADARANDLVLQRDHALQELRLIARIVEERLPKAESEHESLAECIACILAEYTRLKASERRESPPGPPALPETPRFKPVA